MIRMRPISVAEGLPDLWVVLKFGGTSVATEPGWQTIAGACREILAEGHRVLLVCSALAGVSNALDELIAAAAAGEDVTGGLLALREAHIALASDLGMGLPRGVDDALAELEAGLHGVRLLRDASPRVRARLMALGERMSTHLGAAWLETQGQRCAWCDATTLLTTASRPGMPESSRYLAARVAPAPNAEIRARLPDAPIVITQGFVAADHEGNTVLLGRGGSDTSAACLAVIIGAVRAEIWTDVPGLFTANPQQVTGARHLERLGYDEVAAMASLGARVLHPRCIEPVFDASLPLHVRSTYLPDAPGTRVDSGSEPGIKAVTARRGLALLRMCRPSQWQPVGFVADVSACFRRHGMSIDLMSTSPSTVVATVDPSSAPGASFDALLHDLDGVCDVSLQRPVASVSLVGTRVRNALDRLGSAFQELEGVAVGMVAQGAADHHLTFVIRQSAVDEVVRRLHSVLLDEPASETFGPTLAQLSAAHPTPGTEMSA